MVAANDQSAGEHLTGDARSVVIILDDAQSRASLSFSACDAVHIVIFAVLRDQLQEEIHNCRRHAAAINYARLQINAPAMCLISANFVLLDFGEQLLPNFLCKFRNSLF